MNRFRFFPFLAAVLAVSCAAGPRSRPVANELFRPDAEKVRAALGAASGALPDQKAVDAAAQAIWALCKDIHSVRNDLDLAFDRNKNGKIEQYEMQSARLYFFGSSLLNLNRVDPGLASRLSAPPRASLSQEDLKIWNDYLFVAPQKLLKPHALSNAFERKIAEGDPRNLSEKAIRNAVAMVARGAAEAFFQTAAPSQKPFGVARGDVKTKLQEYANTSGSGSVSDAEARAAEEALKTPHEAKSLFDRAIDFEGTGFVSAADIDEARRAAFLPATHALPAAAGPYPVVTKADSLLDLDGDGIVTEDEILAVAKALASGGGAPGVPPKILAAFDADGNGKLGSKEVIRALEFFRPHPVDPANALDVALDAQRTRFLTPDEIGIGAGKTAKGPALSMDERVQNQRFAARKKAPQGSSVSANEGSDAQPPAQARVAQKRLDIAGKKLAVMGLSSATKNVDQESLDGTVTFLENAFVNVGSVSIVDRSDIDKVMKELELQASGATDDEGTAVKAGKLSGADIIATGTISLVGKKYYLNVKLVSVETGEILGSSIASADSPEGFLAMCQEAAVKLF
jgi:hypothetical protein